MTTTKTTTNAGFHLDDVVAILERTPESLRALLDGLSDEWTRATEGEGTWSPYDVVGHLIHGERADWIPRARHILAGNREPFEPFDRWAQFKDSQGKSLAELLTTFASLRKDNIAALMDMQLTEADFRKTGIHPEFGTVTLGQLLATWAVHDLTHIGQIVRVMAKVYANETGPWSRYLSILRDRT